MLRRWWIVAAFTCGLVSLLLGKPGTVKTKSGQTLEGDVSVKENSVEIMIRGVRTIVPPDQIESIEYHESVEQQYKDRLAKLDEKDVAGRVELARWASNREQYKLARDALEGALAIDPNDAEVSRFLDLVVRQMRLRETTAEREEQIRNGTTQPAPVTRPVERGLLSAGDINMIRLMELNPELRPADRNVRITMDSTLREKFAQSRRLLPAEAARATPLQIALEIRANPDLVDLRREVKITTDPQSLADFRRVQRVALSGCAATGCHSGNTGGNFVLIQPADSEAALYTNFYILSEYGREVEGSIPGTIGSGPVRREMIDRTRPLDSLLIQYGLPPETARYPHPAVSGYRGLFRNLNDQRIAQLSNWIANLVNNPKPDYTIEYTPPTATTRPANGGG